MTREQFLWYATRVLFKKKGLHSVHCKVGRAITLAKDFNWYDFNSLEVLLGAKIIK